MKYQNRFGLDVSRTPPGGWRFTINGKQRKTYCIHQMSQWAKDAGVKGSKEEIINAIVEETVPYITLTNQTQGFIAQDDIPICNKNIYVMLGRAGDILCLLPALKYEHDRLGCKIKLVVAMEFASIVEGCSYIEPIVWQDDFRKPNHAAFRISKEYSDYRIVNCAVCAEDMRVDQKGWSFDRDIWTNSKVNAAPHSVPLLFDNRNKEREQALIDAHIPKNGKKTILTAFSGHSSPFWKGEELKQRLTALLPDHNIVDISSINADRFYDMLGLYDVADALVAIDSAPLHLASASNVKTIALVTDQNTLWHQSSWKPHHTFRVPYSKAVDWADRIANAISDGYLPPKIVWVTSSPSELSHDAAKRLKIARRSIEQENELSGGRWIECDFVAPRDGREVGDKPVPFIRNMLDQACGVAEDEDIVLILNSDIGVCTGITGEIIDACEMFGSCYSQRMDFRRIDRTMVNEIEIATGTKYPGADFFAFKKKWWIKRSQFFPDMLLGREAWDMIMRDLVRSTGGIELHNATYHEMHESHWLQNRQCAGNEHNKRLAREWLAANGRQWW
jgi:hypothetical protein